MKRKRNQRNWGYESLEGRKLLAADFGLSFTSFNAADLGSQEPAFGFMAAEEQLGQSMQAMSGEMELFEFDIPSDFEMTFESNSMNAFTIDMEQMAALTGSSFIGEFEAEPMSFEVAENEMFGRMFNSDAIADLFNNDSAFEFGHEEFLVDAIEFADAWEDAWEIDGDWTFEYPDFAEFESETQPNIDVTEVNGQLLDLSDGSDGVFGTLSADNTEDTYSFFTHRDGTASVVVASSIDGNAIVATLIDQDGNEVEATSTDSSSSFNKLSFDVEAGQIYELSIASTEGNDSDYQMTVSFEAAAPVDQHSNETDENATELDVSEGFAEISGLLETDGDVDVFRMDATQGDSFRLFASELDLESNANLKIAVTNTNGETIAAGSTNADLSITFEAAESGTYFVSVSAGDGETGAYQLAVANDAGMDEEYEFDDELDFDPNDGEDLDEVEETDDEQTDDEIDNDDDVDVEGDDDEGEELELEDSPIESPAIELEKTSGPVSSIADFGDNIFETVDEVTAFEIDFGSMLTLAEAITASSPDESTTFFADIDSTTETLANVSPAELDMIEINEVVEFDFETLADFSLATMSDSEGNESTENTQSEKSDMTIKDEILASMFVMMEAGHTDGFPSIDMESDRDDNDVADATELDFSWSLIDNDGKTFWFEELQV